MPQELIPANLMEALRANGAASAAAEGGIDHVPVLKLFTPDANATWLISEIDEDGDTMFGLCDLGLGEPEMGYVSLSEIKEIRGRLTLPVERDEHVTFTKKLTEYADAARAAQRIVL